MALSNKQDRFISWLSNQEKDVIEDGFYQMARFSGVIGCIDCTHIQIQAPHLNENYFVNQKCYHSINAQAICDHQGNYKIMKQLYQQSLCGIITTHNELVELLHD